MRKPTLKTNPGFLLLEAIISITILMMIAATSISLLVMGHRAINVNKNSLEASWLAQEAAESLRGLRDTNWIRYGYDKDLCWNSINSQECVKDSQDFLSGTEDSPRNFSIIIPMSGAPEMVEKEKALNLENGPRIPENQEYLLNYYDLDPATDYDNDGIPDNDKQYIAPKIPLYSPVERSKYYREIQTYIDADGNVEGLVTVGWYEGSRHQQITLPVTLTNYQLEE